MNNPVVTDEMLDDAIRAYNRAYCTKDQVWDDAMRAAITAALEASGELERLRAALSRMLLEFDFMIEAGLIPDTRGDVIFVDARAALKGWTE